VLDVVFALEGGDVGAAEGLAAFVAQQIETAKVVCFAERVLARGLLGDGEELGGDDLAAVLDSVSVVWSKSPTEIRMRTWQVKHSR
jgi:hypothetical protein